MPAGGTVLRTGSRYSDLLVPDHTTTRATSHALRVLIVEDNVFDAELVLYQLRRAGFDPQSRRVEHESAYREALAESWDVILADYMLPLFSAPRALEILRELDIDTPFIVVTGQAGEELAVELIHLGAADYLMKDRLLRLGSAVQRELASLEIRRAKREADRAVRDSERRHRMIAGEVTDYACSLRLHHDGVIEYEWSTPSVEHFLGEPAAPYFSDAHIVEVIHPDDRTRVISQRDRALAGSSSVEEIRLCRCDGRLVWVRNHFLVDTEDLVPGCVRVFIAGQDITRQRLEADALARHTDELVMRNEELDAFAHTVAHDLRNPLNLIVGFADLLSEMNDAPFDELHPHLLTIANTGRLMINIVDELMLLSGVRKANPSMVPVDLRTAADSAVQRLAYLAEEVGAQIDVQQHLPSALGHPPWIEEALVNYLSNAIKYGGAPPRVWISAEELDDGRVRCSVRDNGRGIANCDMESLFMPFRRLETVRAQGHGLGLSIVRRIIERMNGEVGVDSSEGRGSVFSFILPSGNHSTPPAH